MNILVIGGGGREHALVWKLKQSPRVERIRSEEHTPELQSQSNFVCRPLLEKKRESINGPVPPPAHRVDSEIPSRLSFSLNHHSGEAHSHGERPPCRHPHVYTRQRTPWALEH